MTVNMQMNINDSSLSDFNISDLEASVFVPAAIATLSHCGRCDFESFGGVWNAEGENNGFCNFNQSYAYIGCRGNNGSGCQDTYQWDCMW